jgi:hypothetical protein
VTVDHIPSAELVDVTEPKRPWWLPAEHLDPLFRIDQGHFPHSLDKALIEEEQDDVR